jgi:aspartate/methionine/tyrosine aminotransferase
MASLHGFYRPPAGFFLWLDVGDGEKMAKKLWEQAAVRVLPGAYISRDGADGKNPGRSFIRIALVGSIESTAEALDRIVKVL